MDIVEPKTGPIDPRVLDTQRTLYTHILGVPEAASDPAEDTRVFSSTLHACMEEAAGTVDDVIPITQAAYRRVRPAGWSDFCDVLAVEPLDDQHVQVVWSCDPGNHPPEATTVFRRDECVIAR